MEFRTSFTPEISEKKIDLDSKVLTIGSCFSTAMGLRLEQCKFNVLNNPFGTVYNPISIKNLIVKSIDEQKSEDYFLERDSTWLHHNYHSDFRELSKEKLANRINNSLKKVKKTIQKADFVILTLGTAVVYELNGIVISNCHKVPQSNFNKRILTSQEITNALSETIKKISAINSGCEIILTVSPVRHIKDSIPVNSRSKALLIAACNEISDQFQQVQYFPSYEVMMDDLRDYRFYKEDLIHPTPFAEDYIWGLFKNSFFDDSTKTFVKNWGSIQNDLNHKPFQPESEGHQKFLRKLIQKLENLSDRVNVVAEIESVRNQLK